MITLRPYQATDIQRIRGAFASGFHAPLYVLPTGGGKTTIFSSMARSSEQRGRRVLILAHRIELIDQIVGTLESFEIEPDVIASGFRRRGGAQGAANRPVTVASVDTLISRLEDYPCPTLIILDEAHHVAPTNKWSKIFKYYDKAKHLGVTATPIRLDGHGLGLHFDHMILGPTYQELIAGEYLVPLRMFSPPLADASMLRSRYGDYKRDETELLMDKPSITGDALSHYREHANGLGALAFCTTVKHAHNVAEHFTREGVTAYALDGKTAPEIRRTAVKDFREGRIKVLASCDLFSEGFDVPGAHCGILLRPTQSLTLYLQQCGRISRPSPGKAHGIILDHVGNSKFGRPDQKREWELTSDIVSRKQLQARPAIVCPKCYAASPYRSSQCIECGHRFSTKGREEIKTKAGKLVELTPEMAAERAAKMKERQLQGRAKTLEELMAFGKARGYAPEWAETVWHHRNLKRQRP